MSIIHGQPNRIIFVKPKDFLFFHYKPAFIREGERKSYFLKRDCIVISDRPIKVEFNIERIETKDHAELTKVKISIAFKPDISGNEDQLSKCIDAYEDNVTASEWLKIKLEQKLGNKFREYNLASILQNEILEENSLQPLTMILEKWFFEQIKHHNFLVDQNSLMIEFDFQKDIKTFKESLNVENPYHQPIVEYFNQYNTKTEELFELRQIYNNTLEQKKKGHEIALKDLTDTHEVILEQKKKGHEIALKDLTDAHEVILEQKKKGHEIALKDLTDAHEVILEQKKKGHELKRKQIHDQNTISTNKLEVETNNILNEYEISAIKQKNDQEIAIQNMKYENAETIKKLKIKEIDIKLAELKEKEFFDSLEMENKFNLIQKESSLTKMIGEYVSIEDTLKREQLKYQLANEELEDKIEQIKTNRTLENDRLRFAIQDIPEKIAHDRDLENIYTKSLFELLQKLYEVQLILQYQNIHFEENRQVTGNLERLFSSTISSARGIINDFKMVNINKDFEGTITKLFSGMVELLSQTGSLSPAFKDIIKDFNIKFSNIDFRKNPISNQPPNAKIDKENIEEDKKFNDQNF